MASTGDPFGILLAEGDRGPSRVKRRRVLAVNLCVRQNPPGSIQ